MIAQCMFAFIFIWTVLEGSCAYETEVSVVSDEVFATSGCRCYEKQIDSRELIILDNFISDFLLKSIVEDFEKVAMVHIEEPFTRDSKKSIPGRTFERLRNILDPQRCDEHVCSEDRNFAVDTRLSNRDEPYHHDYIYSEDEISTLVLIEGRSLVLFLGGEGEFRFRELSTGLEKNIAIIPGRLVSWSNTLFQYGVKANGTRFIIGPLTLLGDKLVSCVDPL